MDEKIVNQEIQNLLLYQRSTVQETQRRPVENTHWLRIITCSCSSMAEWVLGTPKWYPGNLNPVFEDCCDFMGTVGIILSVRDPFSSMP